MFNKLKEKLPGVVENELLANHTTFKIGGPARYFFAAQGKSDLILAVKTAEELNLEYVVLGWGSNLLVSDNGYDGLVIKNSSNNFKITGSEIYAESGVNLSRLVGEATKAGLSGLEFGAGIPGSVGGACFGNAGALGQGFGDIIKTAEIYQNKKVKVLDKQELNFGYRDSVLKQIGGVVLSVTVELVPTESEIVQRNIVEILKKRKDRIPYEPSAGCVFKNIDLANIEIIDEARVIKALDISQAEWQKVTVHKKLPIGFVIDCLGLKGKTIGGCQISEKHSAFFVNIGQAKAEHVLMLISDVKMRVRDQLGIQLQEEIRYLGF
ncbi:MAG: UDP-N-acetylmuramate dehydrogenase [Candidatus Buchananbacteria bacterium]